MSLRLPEFVVSGRALGVEMEFRRLGSSDGLLLYTGQTDNGRGDYFALAIVDDRVQLRSALLLLLLLTSIQSNLAKGRIADLSPLAAANGFIQSWPHLIHGSFNPHKSAPKRHLDPFSRFCTARRCAQHTNTQTTLHATSVAIGRILCTAYRRRGLIIIMMDWAVDTTDLVTDVFGGVKGDQFTKRRCGHMWRK